MIFSAILVVNIFLGTCVNGLFEFKSEPVQPTQAELKSLRAITNSQLKDALSFGVFYSDGLKTFENNLASRGVFVQNGSISHKQLLETLPNAKALETNIIARKILKASSYIYQSVCVQKNIRPESCAQFLSTKSIPSIAEDVFNDCSSLVSERKDGNHVYRRLLPCNYKDGLHMMNDKLTSPWEISNSAMHGDDTSINKGNDNEDINSKNLALVQWTQFIEHDLSKPVVSSFRDGQSIECCAEGNYVSAPRDLHPNCAPLIGFTLKYGKKTCLNYVRSALSLEACTFGPAQQLNQATGYLDLSQLYGFTKKSHNGMRTFQDGKLKSSKEGLLPMADGELRNSFCAIKSEADEICFMAGDTRVNSNPYSIVLYTIFLRSHNRFADEIKRQNPMWSDQEIYKAAKKLNIQVYREIILNEWLPAALGQKIANNINSEPLMSSNAEADYEVSNEFAAAAIRFYFSMMPNILQRLPTPVNNEITSGDEISNLTPPALFSLMEQMFRSESLDRASKVNEFLASMLNQKALKMDATYADSLIEQYTNSRVPSRPNVLAFDIQRGRDHGLQGYVQYLEQCEGRTIASWDDLDRYMAPAEIMKLKSVYDHVSDVDLIVGGISEIPSSGSTVGPTFTCILGEQFSKIRQWHHNLNADTLPLDSKFKNFTAAKLLCANTGLREVPKNIFFIASDTNPLVPCVDLLNH